MARSLSNCWNLAKRGWPAVESKTPYLYSSIGCTLKQSNTQVDWIWCLLKWTLKNQSHESNIHFIVLFYCVIGHTQHEHPTRFTYSKHISIAVLSLARGLYFIQLESRILLLLFITLQHDPRHLLCKSCPTTADTERASVAKLKFIHSEFELNSTLPKGRQTNECPGTNYDEG